MVYRNKNIETTREVQNLMIEGKYKEAKKILKEAIAKRENPKFKSLLVKLYMVEGNYAKALKELNKYIKEYPYDGTFLAQKVEALVGNGDIQLAKNLLEWLLKNDLVDKRLLLQLKSIAIGENDEKKVQEIEQRLQQNDEKMSDRIEKIKAENIKPKRKKNLGKIELRGKIYQKNKDMRKKLDILNIRAILENEEITEEIEEIRDYYVGMTKFGIIEGAIKPEDIKKIINAYKKIGEKQKAISFVEDLDSIRYAFSLEEIKEIQDIKNKTKKKDFSDYFSKIASKNIQGKDIVQIINKIAKLQGDTLEKRILAIKLFDDAGYNSYKERAIDKAIKGAKTEKEVELINKAIKILDEQKIDNNIVENKKGEVPEESVGGESR